MLGASVDVLVRLLTATLPHHSESQVDVERWLRDMPWERESVLFARHYRYEKNEASERPAIDDDGMVGAHTDSGVMTLLFAPHTGTFMDFEMLCLPRVSDGNEELCWRSPGVSLTTHDGGVMLFSGEMMVALVADMEQRFEHSDIKRSTTPVRACVHRVISKGIPDCCRHAYAFQLRLPVSVLQGRNSRLQHRVVSIR